MHLKERNLGSDHYFFFCLLIFISKKTLENKNISKIYSPNEFHLLKAKMKASALESVGRQMDILLRKEN